MAKALKLALIATAFLLVTFLALELSLRVYFFGSTGLSLEKVRSFALIFNSGLVQAADDLDVWYELKPDQSALFRGVPFRTNSQGLADDEYAVDKPPRTVRVAVVGSSWSMGSGVERENNYHSVLERQFNSAGGPVRFEFINFGVEFYGLQEIVATVRHKALRYEPDLILMEITDSTPSVRWTPHEARFVPPAPGNAAWDSIVVQQLVGRLGLSSRAADDVARYRDRVARDEWGVYFEQIERAFYELGSIGKANGIPVAAVWLRANVPADDTMDQWFFQRAKVNGLDAAVISLDAFLEPGENLQELLVSRVEPHPNARGHELIAGELRRQLFADNPLFASVAQ